MHFFLEIGDLQEKVRKLISHLESIEEENEKRKNEKLETNEKKNENDIFGFTTSDDSSNSPKSSKKRKNLVDSDDSMISNSSKNSKSSKLSKYGESELQLAAAEGNLEKVQNCLNCGMSVLGPIFSRKIVFFLSKIKIFGHEFRFS